MRRSTVLSSAFSPLTAKYLRCTVSLYSDDICSLSPLKLSIESFKFFLIPLTTANRVRSEDEPGPQSGKLRLASLDRSSDSNRTLMSLAFFREIVTSESMAERSSFTACALCRVLLFACEFLRLVWSFSNSFSSSFSDSTSWKNFSRVCAGAVEVSAIWMMWWWLLSTASKSFIFIRKTSVRVMSV